MKNILILMAFAACTALPVTAAEHEHHAAPASADAAKTDDQVRGEIRAIDRENGKLTLRHEAIPKFEMAAMTMAFRVADPALLSGFTVGDRVLFAVEKLNGRLVVVAITRQP